MSDALVAQTIDPVCAPGDRAASGISFSKAGRGVQCLASTVLPRVQDSEPSEPAEKGKAIHAFLADAAKVGKEAALEEVSEEYLEICAAIDLSKIPTVDAERYAHETAMAYDALEDRARIIGYDVGRNYGELADGEIPGTIDVLGLTEDGEGVVVGDYKSGRLAVPPPKKNWQLKIGAVAAARKFGRRYAVLMIIHTPEGSKPWVEYGRLDAFELDEAAEQLRELVLQRRQLVKAFLQRGFAGLGTSIVRGPECTYCQSFAFCPAQTSHVRAVLGDPLAFQRELVTLISSEQVGLAKVAFDELKALVKHLEEQIKGCATQRPATLPDGRFYGPVQQPDDELDAGVVLRVMDGWLPELVAGDVDKVRRLLRTAVEMSASKASIERALQEIAPRGALASMKREAFARIKAAGGVKEGVKLVVREYSGEAPKRLSARVEGT